MVNFNRGRSGGGRSFGKRNFGGSRQMGRPQMHNAVCSNCGKECQVPFKPTGEKPVYCRDCFAKMNGDSRGNFERNNRNERPAAYTLNKDSRSQSAGDQQLREINAKLDKILTLLTNDSPIEEEKVQSEILPIVNEAKASSQNEEMQAEKAKRVSKKIKKSSEE